MQDFIERTNIANFTERLKTETEPTKRVLLAKLLAAEETKRASRLMEAKASICAPNQNL
jgi:hypothetical protein